MPARKGHGASSGATACWKWFDTIAPRIGSAGELGHQPTTSDVWPVCLPAHPSQSLRRLKIASGIAPITVITGHQNQGV